MILTKPFSSKPVNTSISSGDSADKHQYPIPHDSYFTGFIVNRDSSNVLDVETTSDGTTTLLPLLPNGVFNYKNQKIDSLKMSLDPSNSAASGVKYLIEGKVHVPSTDTERMFLESDSEFFFRRLSSAVGGVFSTDSFSIGDDINDNLGFHNAPNLGGQEVFFIDSNGNIQFSVDGSGLATSATHIGLANGGVLRLNAAKGIFDVYQNIPLNWLGFPSIYGNPDYRTGLTASDGAAITVYTTVNGTSAFRFHARIFSTTFGANSTYVLKWTEGGVVQTVTLTSTAANDAGAAYTDRAIQPDTGTAITIQFTVGAGSTCNVAGWVEEVK